MSGRIKRIQIPLVMAICLFVMVLPAYLRSNDFSGTKSASSDFIFQNPDQENELPDGGKNELKAFGSAAFFAIFLLSTNLSEHSSHPIFRALSLCQKASILRC
jgi:hypothetical protein